MLERGASWKPGFKLRQFVGVRDFFSIGQDAHSLTAMIARSVFVPNNREQAAVIFDTIETEPVPDSVRQQRPDFDRIIGARHQADDAGDEQISERRMIVVAAASVFADRKSTRL